MIFVAGADEEDVFHWDVPAGLFNDEGEMVWEPERWLPENAHVEGWDKQSAKEATGPRERNRASHADRAF